MKTKHKQNLILATLVFTATIAGAAAPLPSSNESKAIVKTRKPFLTRRPALLRKQVT